MANLTIRNLTVDTIELIEIERYEGERVRTGDVVSNMTNAISGFINATDFSAHETRAQGKALHKDKANVRIEPFKTKETDIRAADKNKEVIRLTFKVADHKYEVDVPSPSRKSAVMKKLDNGPKELTAVYTQNGAFLAVFSSARLNAWMKELHDDWPLPMLSIPGTHNAATHHKALPSVRCQSATVSEQLLNGVRFLDVRVSANPDNDELTIVHGAFPISLTGNKYLKDFLEDTYEFLDKNPSESLILSLKREGTGKGTDQQMGKYLKNSYVDKKRGRWWTEPKVPTLGAARGKIILVRRFAIADDQKKACWDGRGWGIDASIWPDNCEDGKTGGGHIRVQDFYEVTETENLEKKTDFARRQLERAAEQNFLIPGMDGHKEGAKTPPFFVNFLSANYFFNANCWPERVAAKLNPSMIEYLCIRHGDEGKGPRKLKVGSGSTGILVTDWVGAHGDWDLIRCIVGMNARLQHKKK
ncbi:PLC-like phosphodiesterase [Ilyonectria robusta]|uniref:PLC-like phosphodiesterase n=1 Tax=Ilyonectria robusta TaxID=1079257 RepID=UPI001E8E1902|nr:PLC-like phosphodiesterase [Ilyonectria robusta]KAH8737351.1 PLC-like phosphodiesterase [Ilyonectria robusta]